MSDSTFTPGRWSPGRCAPRSQIANVFPPTQRDALVRAAEREFAMPSLFDFDDAEVAA